MSKVAKKTVLADGTIVTPKKYNYVSAEDFSFVEEPTEVSFKPAQNVDEALNRLPTDPKRTLKLLNGMLSRETMFTKRAEVESKGLDSETVNRVFSGFRALFPIDETNGPIKTYDEQTCAIANMVKGAPAIVASIQKASEIARANADGDDTEGAE